MMLNSNWVLILDILSVESAKLRAPRAKNVFTCQRVLRAYVLTCQRALHACVVTCQRAMRA